MGFLNVILSVHIGLVLRCVLAYKIKEFEIRMPNVLPDTPDAYLHTTQALGDDSDNYIVAFEPMASMDVVHHMMVHGCNYAGELESRLGDCNGEKTLFYVWGRNAPSLYLPKDVGFKVGKSAKIQYISLEVHYANVSSLQGGLGDVSGVKLYLTSTSLPKRAGVILLATGGYIKGGTTEHFEVACRVTSDTEVHPFAFRTHAHDRALLISGYRVRGGKDGPQNWSLIGKKNPLLPQYFYPVEDDSMVIRKGDILAARCTMRNNETRTIYIGSTSKDEMCNFYIMFYVENSDLDIHGCFSSGPPDYYWASDSSLNNIPLDASKP